MQVLWTLFGQRPDLAPWEARPVAAGVAEGSRPGDRRDAFEREVAVERPGEPEPEGPFRRAADAVCRFHVFPPRLVTPVLRRAPVQAGDTVGICYHFAPGVDLFFAARVTACFDGPAGGVWKTGFTYRTLHGHPELGEETFSAEKDLATGRVLVALRSWSRPGTFLTWAAAPVTRWMQVHANNSALAHLAGVARGLSVLPTPP
jgi:uncharacterized protein (UPF0548 family)